MNRPITLTEDQRRAVIAELGRDSATYHVSAIVDRVISAVNRVLSRPASEASHFVDHGASR